MSDTAPKPEAVVNNGIVWTDISEPGQTDITGLAARHSFHKLNIEDCLSKIQIPKIDRYSDHIFVILHFPTPNKEKGFVFSQLSIFLGPNYLVTIHQGELRPLSEMFNQCKIDERMRQTLMGRSTGYLLYKIIDILIDDLLHILMKVVGNIDDIEDLVFDERTSIPRQISLLRREITTLRRIVIPLRKTIIELSRDIQSFSKDDMTPYLKDVQDHIEKVADTLEGARETVEIFKDTDFMLSTERTNKILAVLTIVFTLSIPASIIGTFYGMNVPLPGGLSDGVWEQLGPFTTLIFILSTSLGSAVIMLLAFRRLGWVTKSI